MKFDKIIKIDDYPTMDKSKNTSLSLQTPCPACHGKLSLKALGCVDCGCEVKGAISISPFAALPEELAHFLMIFVHCGGKIGDVEKALGISYPTVKAKLKKLQSILTPPDELPAASKKDEVMQLLSKMETGELDYNQVIDGIKDLKES